MYFPPNWPVLLFHQVCMYILKLNSAHSLKQPIYAEYRVCTYIRINNYVSNVSANFSFYYKAL